MSEVKNVQKTGCAVIGYGGMGGWHTRYILESDVAYLCGIYDINPVKVELAKTNGIRAYESLEELLADDEIKFVTIATPNEVHAEIAIKALRAGKHVITEKPVVLNSDELEEVIAVANECGRLFTVHQNRRWDIDFRMMRETYLSGKLGKVFSCESRIHGSRGVPGDWRGKPEHGGGMIYDWGVHLIDQMLLIFEDKKIKAVRCLCDGNELDLVVREKLFKRLVRANAVGLCKLNLNGIDVVDTAKVSDVALKYISGVPATHSTVSDDGAAGFHCVFNFTHNISSRL